MSNEHENSDLEKSREDSIETGEVKRTNRALIIFTAAALAAVLVIVFAFLYLRSGTEGRPVPAPRNISIDESNTTPTEATITLSPEAVERAGIKIEMVGEQLSSETGTTTATGVVQANAYRETPVISLVGGIIRH